MNSDVFDTIVIGTGFASSFFLQEYLRKAPKNFRVLVLERGGGEVPSLGLSDPKRIQFHRLIDNLTPEKPWIQRIGFGGGTCWTGNTPRMHPNDFRTKSLYGVGEDWPISYDELEPFYVSVEYSMAIAGADGGPFPRSVPYPMPAHRLNALDRAFAKKYPNDYLPMPSARSSSIKSKRAVCCVNGVCATCPISAKFQIDRHLHELFADPRVTLKLDANVTRLEITGNTATGAHYFADGREQFARCDLAAVGAHAIMSPYILLNSGIQDRSLGRYLNEQVALSVDVMLDGVPNYDGSQIMTGFGTMHLDGPFRANAPGYLLENWNLPWLRAEHGRWRERGFFKLVFEELPRFGNYVGISKADPTKPEVYYGGNSSYATTALENARSIVEDLLDGMPVEEYHIHKEHGLGTEAHVQGTMRMGNDANTSVVDHSNRCHKVPNVVALGSGVFPTCPAANPTLTLSALAVRAAHLLF